MYDASKFHGSLINTSSKNTLYPVKNYMFDASIVHSKKYRTTKNFPTFPACVSSEKKLEDPHVNAKSHLHNKNYTH